MLDDALMERLSQRKAVVFLDYDGTLTPIVDRPQDAVLSAHGRAAVTALCAALPTAVISGRDRADVEALVGIPGLVYAGSHGFDVDLPDHPSLAPQPEGVEALLDQVEKALERAVGTLPGALIERKALSIAAHYRLLEASDLDRFMAGVDAVLAQFPALHEKPGKKVRELLPAADWDKGQCVLALLRAMGQDDKGYIALFIGDDRTDEDAFAALRQRGPEGGVGIVVADPNDPENAQRKSHADYWLASPDQVLTFLSALSHALGGARRGRA
jgi:trehalose 6-phosphate phosphatase